MQADRADPDLITGDAVVLDLRAAKLASRGLAFGLDVLVQAAALLILLLALSSLADLDEALLSAVMLTSVVLVLVGYPVVFETLSRGRSLGKLAMGLRVVRDDGGPIRFRHALTRGLAGVFVDFWLLGLFGAVALVVSLVSPKGKRVGDYLAGTLVVRERAPRSTAPELTMPPPLAHWAARLDLTNLPDHLALGARQYIARYPELRPAAREQLGRDLAEQVAGHIGAPLPPSVPPWAYLAAVLAERRAREHARLAGHHPASPAAPVPPPGSPTEPPTPPTGQRVEPPTPPTGQRRPDGEPPADRPFAPPS
ncbi:Uncharacterized membrane protein YckC, RDD family [Amycolatopsis arida]|uniref:Uncharacterized membrane protein YckC, RDD family n=1 Tax=Amycolatopsis arida TaxID=587909 RepID=A0A1I5WBE0_9PSEU|nr:RDD family protein [Amycolatopsis arida]TDX92199.1 putative RDD family membrane protein YckC [Amycolatopsis arida]SFQ16999.1 Uncharacterized membrane protein YckC, RDD family [Amycolatopsis arida]